MEDEPHFYVMGRDGKPRRVDVGVAAWSYTLIIGLPILLIGVAVGAFLLR